MEEGQESGSGLFIERPPAEALKPANKIFFHTTPTINLRDIWKNGLIADNNRDVVGRDLLYSLTFPKEYNGYKVGRATEKTGPVDNFSLVIWKDSADIKQVKRDHLTHRQFRAARPLTAEDTISQRFLDSRSGGRWQPEVEKEQLRKVSRENFLASIPITEEIQKFLTRSKLEFVYNLATAGEIEKRLAEFLTEPSRHVILSGEYQYSDLAHDLTSHLQREVLLNWTSLAAKSGLRFSEEAQLQTDKILKALQELKTKAEMTNDPTCRQYMDNWLKRYQAALAHRGLLPLYQKAKPVLGGDDLLEVPEADPNKLWGGSDGYGLALSVARELEIYI